ncbi:hypothetical protein ABCS02_24635 [Microbacterium sp. X-17]|uniref:hypothetical protein n=1 Tax=Microbacterium sp. X-17 TaxID=3144404 RepID=UPI0031F496C6
MTLVSFFFGQVGWVVMACYWSGGFIILTALRRLVLDPWLDGRYPLSRHRRRRIRTQVRAESTDAG